MNTILLSLGWTIRGDANEWQTYVSPNSQPRGGPVCHIEYQPAHGCVGWSIGDERVGPFENREEVVAIMLALKIPVIQTQTLGAA